MVQFKTLRNIAVGGAFVCLASGMYFQSKIQNRFKQAEYYKESLRILRENRAVIQLMGQPIRDGVVDLADLENNYADTVTAKLKVPVRGKLKTGQLYLWASRTDPGVPWLVDRLELAFKTEPDRRLLVYDRNRTNVDKSEPKTV